MIKLYHYHCCFCTSLSYFKVQKKSHHEFIIARDGELSSSQKFDCDKKHVAMNSHPGNSINSAGDFFGMVSENVTQPSGIKRSRSESPVGTFSRWSGERQGAPDRTQLQSHVRSREDEAARRGPFLQRPMEMIFCF